MYQSSIPTWLAGCMLGRGDVYLKPTGLAGIQGRARQEHLEDPAREYNIRAFYRMLSIPQASSQPACNTQTPVTRLHIESQAANCFDTKKPEAQAVELSCTIAPRSCAAPLPIRLPQLAAVRPSDALNAAVHQASLLARSHSAGNCWLDTPERDLMGFGRHMLELMGQRHMAYDLEHSSGTPPALQAAADPLYLAFLRIIRCCRQAQHDGIDIQLILRRLTSLSHRHEQLASSLLHSSQL